MNIRKMKNNCYLLSGMDKLISCRRLWWVPGALYSTPLTWSTSPIRCYDYWRQEVYIYQAEIGQFFSQNSEKEKKCVCSKHTNISSSPTSMQEDPCAVVIVLVDCRNFLENLTSNRELGILFKHWKSCLGRFRKSTCGNSARDIDPSSSTPECPNFEQFKWRRY